MKFIQGQNRNQIQLFPVSLDESIDPGRRRQAIVEHLYGTIKRQWGFRYVLTKKGKVRASADVGFMLVAYNLRRIGNILTLKVLKENLGMLVSVFSAIFDLTEAV